VALPSLTGKVWSGLAANSSRKSGLMVAGSLPMMPARAARSVPWPFPGGAQLPNRLTFMPVALASWSAGSLVQRW